MRFSAPLAFALALLLLLLAPAIRAEEEEPQPPRAPPERGGGMWDRMKRHDADGDGKVSREEFQGPDRYFDRMDADRDGFVTQAEADRMQGGRSGGRRPTGQGSSGPTGITFTVVDANGDGVITMAEWLSFFAAADADTDGRVTKDEWASMLKPTRRPGGQAPAVGAKAPDVRAVPLAGGEPVDLGSPKRTTVLIFGSWT